MSKFLFSFLFFIANILIGFSQTAFIPYQPEDGPGSARYLHEEVIEYDFAKKADGYWLYEPAAPVPDSANVIVFVHGYGGYNPMIYGKWVKHLVRQGNIVIYPRYQANNLSPRPPKFTRNVSSAVREALKYLKEKNKIQPMTEHLSFVGHSYGGVISANLAINFKQYGIPQPKAVMLVSPGSGPFKGGVLKSYEAMPEDLKLLVMVSNNDRTVGDKLGVRVFETAINVRQRNFIRQYHDGSTFPSHSAGHNESYAVDLEFDNGIRNFTSKRALRMGRVNNVDYFGYWKLFDALLDCTRSDSNCEYAFGNTEKQYSLGFQENGQPLRALEVIVPEVRTVRNVLSSSEKK